jgi:hypothetical protein
MTDGEAQLMAERFQLIRGDLTAIRHRAELADRALASAIRDLQRITEKKE